MRVLLLGASGTIGSATLNALIHDGHEVVCFLRDKYRWGNLPPGMKAANRAQLRFGNVASRDEFAQLLKAEQPFDAVVSCLASRTGMPRDAWAIDYQLHSDILRLVESAGIKQFILLSAMCVQKPLLAFQQAKLAFESELIRSSITHTIVRPTAFFKSLSGQIQRLKKNKSFLLFADGQLTACKPISDQDLGRFMSKCLVDADKHNKILPIGGPGPAVTPLQQGQYLFHLLGKKEKYTHVPVAMLAAIIWSLKVFGWLIPSFADKAELARIGHYYATESMLVWNEHTHSYDAQATPSFGSQTLFDHYKQLIADQIEVDLGDHSVF